MFTLAVAVGPDHEYVRVPCSHFNIPDEFCCRFFVFYLHGRVKQDERITCVPFAMCFVKVEFSDMTCNIGDSESGIYPWIVERIVAYAPESVLEGNNLSGQEARKGISRMLTVS